MLVFWGSILHVTFCPCCNINESWEIIGFSCLACQFTAIVFWNPFHLRFQWELEQWLLESDTESSNYEVTNFARAHTPHKIQSDQDMLQKRNQAIEQSFQEIKGKATPEQTRFIFENLSLIQRNIQGSLGNLKRDCTSQEQSSITSCTEDCNLSPREKSSLSRKLFQEESINSNNNLPTLRPPLMNLDPNSINNSGGKKSRKSGVYSQEMMNCIWRAKEMKRLARKKNDSTGLYLLFEHAHKPDK